MAVKIPVFSVRTVSVALYPELGRKETQAPGQTHPGTGMEGRKATRLASSRTSPSLRVSIAIFA